MPFQCTFLTSGKNRSGNKLLEPPVEPAAPDPQLFSPTGEKFENWGPQNTISLREMCIPSAPEFLEIPEIGFLHSSSQPAQAPFVVCLLAWPGPPLLPAGHSPERQAALPPAWGLPISFPGLPASHP